MAKRKNITDRAVQSSEIDPDDIPIEARPEIDDDCDSDGFTVKQRLFVAAIIGPALGNATKAAKMAGYRDDNNVALRATAYENLTKPHIKEAIRLGLARKCGDAEWTRLSIVDLARSSIENFMVVSADGSKRLDFAMAAAAGALGQIKEYEEKQVKDADGNTVILPKIKCHDRLAALALMARMHGLVKETIPASANELLTTDPALASAPLPPGAVPSMDESSEV